MGRNLHKDFPQGCISIVRVCRWQYVQQIQKYVPRSVPIYPPMGKKCVHFVYNISSRVTMPWNRTKSSKSRGKKPHISYKPGISFNALNGETISALYSDEYEFDASEYQNGIFNTNLILMSLQVQFTNHKFEVYSSKDKLFLDLSAKDLRNKSI